MEGRLDQSARLVVETDTEGGDAAHRHALRQGVVRGGALRRETVSTMASCSTTSMWTSRSQPIPSARARFATSGDRHPQSRSNSGGFCSTSISSSAGRRRFVRSTNRPDGRCTTRAPTRPVNVWTTSGFGSSTSTRRWPHGRTGQSTRRSSSTCTIPCSPPTAPSGRCRAPARSEPMVRPTSRSTSRTLSAAYLGAVSWNDLVSCGAVDAGDDVVRRLDVLFAVRPNSFCGTGYVSPAPR